MEYFNHGMTQYSPAAQSLSLEDINNYIRKDYNGHIFYKESQYSNNFVDLQAVVNNLAYLNMKVDQNAANPQFQELIESMAATINKLSEENYELQQRLDKLEMLIGEN